MEFKAKLAVMVVAASALVGAQVPKVDLPPSPRGTAAIQVGGTWSGTGADRRYAGG